MNRSASILFAALFLCVPLGSQLHAAIEKDLGQSLHYLRVTDARADKAAVTAAIAQHPQLVLDLRNLNAETDFIAALHDTLAKKPAAPAARFVLINAATSPAVRATLDDDALLSVITLGPKTKALATDIAVSISAEEDARAFAALANGTALEKLIADPVEKRRYDEAKLVQDHTNGVSPADAELPADAEDESVATEPANGKKTNGQEKKATPPPRDLVLERAVQLHRALLALKKL